MSEAHLVMCPACSRHARVSEPTCPFCGAAFDEALRATPERLGPAMRLSRAALVAFGAGALAVPTVACSSSSPPVLIAPAYGVVAYTGVVAVPDGIVFGTTSCTGEVYFVFCEAWGFCEEGVWTYTDLDPTSFGSYLLDPSIPAASCDAGASASSSGTSGESDGGDAGRSTSSTSAADGGRG
jgi:hypothetical protein